MFDECRTLIEQYKETLKNTEGRSLEDFYQKPELSTIEKELNLNRISVFASSNNEINSALAEPFTGKWRFEENDRHINWEITKDNHNLCRYFFQTKRGENEWVDDDIAVTRYRLKQVDSKTIIEEYNVRSNELTVSEIVLVNDELQVKAIENGEMRVFRRVK
jgi:hypothetical protein